MGWGDLLLEKSVGRDVRKVKIVKEIWVYGEK